MLRHGIELHPYADGAAALLSLSAEDPAAVLAPTDMEGVDLLRFVHAVVAWSDVPIIIGLTATPSCHELAYEALEKGARALIALPFAPAQLASAIRHVGLRRTTSAAPLSYGPITLDRVAHRVLVYSTALHFSPQEVLLLEYLMNEAPRTVSLNEIGAMIGDSATSGGDMRIRKLIEKVRRKLLTAAPTQPSLIETVRGLGYRLNVSDQSRELG